MSDLRDQLRNAKEAYQSLRYPGDLVSDLKRSHSKHNPLRWVLPLGTAVAALVALAVWLRPTAPIVNPEPTDSQLAHVEFDAIAPEHVAMPADVVPMVPSATFAAPSSVSVPSMPSIPTWSVSTDVSLDGSTSG
jgi:hypothetical protein